MKKIKAIFVDVINRQVSEVEIEENLQSYYRLLHCNTIAAPSFDTKHDVIVDDEGLLKEPIGFFEITTEFACEFAGNGLIVGVNSRGEWISHKLDIEEVKKQINFITYIKFHGQIVKIAL